MNMQEKIQYVIDNEGCEGADGFSGLQMFLRHCVNEDSKEFKPFIEQLKPIVDYWYETTKEYVDEQESWELRTFKELPTACVVCKDELKIKKFIKVGNLLFNLEGDQVEYTDEEKFRIELCM